MPWDNLKLKSNDLIKNGGQDEKKIINDFRYGLLISFYVICS